MKTNVKDQSPNAAESETSARAVSRSSALDQSHKAPVDGFINNPGGHSGHARNTCCCLCPGYVSGADKKSRIGKDREERSYRSGRYSIPLPNPRGRRAAAAFARRFGFGRYVRADHAGAGRETADHRYRLAGTWPHATGQSSPQIAAMGAEMAAILKKLSYGPVDVMGYWMGAGVASFGMLTDKFGVPWMMNVETAEA